jgi:hypothetical protein
VRRLHLRWSSDPRDLATPPAADDLVLVFAPSAAPPLGSANVVFADDLIGWEERSQIEHRAADLMAALRARAPDAELMEASEYELRVEWLNVLLAHAVASGLREAGPFAEVRPSTMTPAAILAGVSSALDIDAPTPARPGPTLAHSRQSSARDEIARLVIGSRSALTRRGEVKVLTFPGLKLGDALGEVSSEALRGIGVAVAAFAELGHGEAAKLILRRGLPAVALPTRRAGAPAAVHIPLEGISGSDEVDAALAEVARVPLARGARRAPEMAALVAVLERLPHLRAVVVSTSALGVTRLLRRWAAQRGVAFASFQHGIYGLIEGDGGDRRADVLFTWGQAVAGQVEMWPAPRPRVELVGVPGLARATRPARPKIERVLVATTNLPLGTALARWSTREDFLDALADGLARLRAAGVAVELRPHPVETPQEYAIMDSRAGRQPLPLAPPGPFADVARRADLVVTPYSSVAFEAAALAIPVAMWLGRIPVALRREHMLPPASEDLPGTFADAAEFDSLVASVLANGPRAPLELSRKLTSYVAPLDSDRFAAALARLGS